MSVVQKHPSVCVGVGVGGGVGVSWPLFSMPGDAWICCKKETPKIFLEGLFCSLRDPEKGSQTQHDLPPSWWPACCWPQQEVTSVPLCPSTHPVVLQTPESSGDSSGQEEKRMADHLHRQVVQLGCDATEFLREAEVKKTDGDSCNGLLFKSRRCKTGY